MSAQISARCLVCDEPLGVSTVEAIATIDANGHRHPGHPKSIYDANDVVNPDGKTNEEVLAGV